jgi:hypothetical protein
MIDLLDRTANYILYKQTLEAIRLMLLDEGLTEYQAWLTYVGAKMIAKNRDQNNEFW